MVGELPEITEVEPNSEKSAPQKIASLPVVIDGQILDTDRDYFQFPAKAGVTLVLSVEARSLLPFIADAVPGWFDPQLTVYDAAGKQVASPMTTASGPTQCCSSALHATASTPWNCATSCIAAAEISSTG